MKIALIEPAASEANVYSKLHMPLLGPLYLGAILKNKGHEVEIYHEEIYTPDYSKLEVDLIGISILTSTAKRGYEIAGKFPKEKVIIGGVHASLMPEEALRFARQVVVGEAEHVIEKVVNGEIKAPIVYGSPVENLDCLPYPDFSLIKGYKTGGSPLPISTSRGCPFDCTFCSVTKVFGRKYRFRSAGNVLGELTTRKANMIFFCDDNFVAHAKRTRELLKLMADNRIGKWACQVRCDAARDPGMLELMHKAGCKVVCVGFESVNLDTLKAFQKKQTIDDIIHAIRSFHKHNISIHGMFVLGGDHDTKETVWETVKFAIKQKIDTIQMMILTPLPGTKVFEEFNAQKRIFSYDWELYDGQHVVFTPQLLSAKQLQSTVAEAYTKFYSLYRSFSLLLKWSFRNALLRFMGHRIVKEWTRINNNMSWLKQDARQVMPLVKGV